MKSYQAERNLIGLWHILDRAVEVAKTGGHTLTVYFSKEYANGFDDYQSIKSFYRGWFDGFSENGDMVVEIVEPEYGIWNETLKDISARVKNSLKNPVPDASLDRACESLLNVAIRKMYLSVDQVDTAKYVALTIARMYGVKKIEAQHIAEAIQYCIRFKVGAKPRMYNAESGVIMFSDMIQIKPGKIDKDQARGAIKYLESMLD